MSYLHRGWHRVALFFIKCWWVIDRWLFRRFMEKQIRRYGGIDKIPPAIMQKRLCDAGPNSPVGLTGVFFRTLWEVARVVNRPLGSFSLSRDLEALLSFEYVTDEVIDEFLRLYEAEDIRQSVIAALIERGDVLQHQIDYALKTEHGAALRYWLNYPLTTTVTST